jgi:hypothetical protein
VAEHDELHASVQQQSGHDELEHLRRHDQHQQRHEQHQHHITDREFILPVAKSVAADVSPLELG